jgi:hypothetical protein
MQRRRQLAEGAPHLFRRLQIGLRSHGFDGQCRQVQAVSTALPEDTVGRRAAADRLENLVRQRVVRRAKRTALVATSGTSIRCAIAIRPA